MTKTSGQSAGQRVSYCAVLLMVALSVSGKAQGVAVGKSWGPYRGANTGRGLSEADVRDFARLGGNLFRLSFPTLPLMKLEPDYAFNEQAFAYLEQVLDWCERHAVHVVIDPHKFPGTEHPWTMLPTDPFWEDFVWHDRAIALWEEIARRCRNRGDVIAGYDLLNEPHIRLGDEKGSPRDLNLLCRKLIQAIRKHDTKHTILVAAPAYRDAKGGHGYLDGIQLLEKLPDDNIVYEVHCYDPGAFTHQGVFEKSDKPVHYPGTINGIPWDIDELERRFQPAVKFQKEHGVPIFMGEFSAVRWMGKDGNQYVEDVISLCEKYGWSWAYHAYRESWVWDPEMSNEDGNDRSRKESTPRLEILRRYFKRNATR